MPVPITLVSPGLEYQVIVPPEPGVALKLTIESPWQYVLFIPANGAEGEALIVIEMVSGGLLQLPTVSVT